MILENKDVFQNLLKRDRTFSKLYQEHKNLDLKLKKLSKQRNLTPFEQLESVKLKRLKLKMKDEMQRILVSYSPKKGLG